METHAATVRGFHGDRWLLMYIDERFERTAGSSSVSSESSSVPSLSKLSIWKRFIADMNFLGCCGARFSFFGAYCVFGKGCAHSSGYHSIFMPLYVTRDIMQVLAKSELLIELREM